MHAIFFVYVATYLVGILFMMPLARVHVCVTSADGWTKVTLKHCHGNRYAKLYNNLKSAKEACGALGGRCAGVYDLDCDGAGLFKLCKPGAFGHSDNSCVYTSPGRYIYVGYVCMSVYIYIWLYMCGFVWLCMYE